MNHDMNVLNLRSFLGFLFMIAGGLHFVRPSLYEAIMPDYLPWHRQLVLLSGAAEMAGGVLLLIPGMRFLARWWMTAVLIAIFPANVHMALHPQRYPFPRWVLWLRLPLQGVLLALVFRATGEKSEQ